MLAIALELARDDSTYEDVASKFWEHFLYIAAAMNNLGLEGVSLWDEADGFYYDVLHAENGDQFPLKVRSMVGLIPLFAVETLEPEVLAKLPGFKKRLEWRFPIYGFVLGYNYLGGRYGTPWPREGRIKEPS
jgi:hypothetical protein